MKCLLLLILLLPVAALAQSSRKGTYIGASLGYTHYTTNWYYYRADARPRRENYPEHSTGRVLLSVTLDKKSFIQTDNFHFDIGGEFVLGVGGKATGEWIAQEPVISSGGLAVGLGGSFKAVYPIGGGKDQPSLAPFLGLGPQITMLHNNGKGLEGFATEQYYNYSDGWNEFLFQLQGSLGLDIHLSSFTLTPELRFGVLGFSSTDWGANEEGVEGDGAPGTFGFSFKIAKKLR